MMIRKPRSRAFVLASVFFVMVVIVLLIASLFRLVPQEVRWSGDHRRETVAYYTATGGVKHALTWLRSVRLDTGGNNEPFNRTAASEPYERINLTNPESFPLRLVPAVDPNPDGLETFFPPGLPVLRSRPGRVQLPGGWSAEVYIIPDKRTFPHPFLAGSTGTLPACYTVLSLAYRDANGNGSCDVGVGENYALRVETSIVERTFARYAYFVDQWANAAADTARFAVLPGLTEAIFSGPVHSNDTPVVQVTDSAFWSQATTFPQPFGDDVSFAGDTTNPKVTDSLDGIAYFGGNFQGSSEDLRPYRGTGTNQVADRTRYERLYKKGQGALRRTQRIDFPTSWRRAAEAAWGVEAGREVVVDSAPQNQVFINPQDLGIAATGSLRRLSLDVVDGAGQSRVFNMAGEFTATTSVTGEQALRFQQEAEITYVAGTRDVPVYSQSLSETVGTFTQTNLDFSDTPQPGYSETTVQQQTGTTTQEFPSYVITGSTVYNDPPGGAGPAGGGSVTTYQYGTTMVEVTRPVYEDVTRYVQVTEVTGTGTYTTTTDVQVGTTQEPILESFAPQTAVVSAKDNPVRLPVNYFLETNTGAGDFPVLIGGTTPLEVVIPKGKTAFIDQDRMDGRSFSVRLLDGQPKGVVGVFGNVTNLSGVNKGDKTVFAAQDLPGARLNPTTLANVTINNPLWQHGLAPGAMPTGPDNPLGIIGGSIVLLADQALLARFPAANPFYIYASLLSAQGGFRAGPLPTSGIIGELRVVGGVAQRAIGKLVEGGNGWSSRYSYDGFQSLRPPPIFPPDGRFDTTFFRVTAP